ncbi:MAG: glutamate-1-semialdehyde 2,1-aminomutase, partial [Candidatus Lindowbacteria bacterium]|nr:glutamate-1-semialdehyde 2,1-aminomutase [Candidatus Lindowbacteria bacterium]
VRAFKSVGGKPVFIERAEGAYLYDVDGNQYIDYIGAWGPMIVGHSHAQVVKAVKEAGENGFAFGTPSIAETELANLIIDAVPSIEVVRLVNSGTEATMSAIRLARGYTGRSKIVKFAGCYHGHADYLLVKAGSGAATLGVPDSAGVPEGLAADTLSARFNDIEDVERIFEEHGKDVACVIIEPIAGNMGVIPPDDHFLQGLHDRCHQHGALLIFDEVMTGFRISRGGAQKINGITPDLTCLGKVIGGGLPVGAYGASREIMDSVSPKGPVYQAGTNSGNPISMAAGIATLNELTPEFYEGLNGVSEQLGDGLAEIFSEDAIVQRAGSMMTLFFLKPGLADWCIRSFDDADKIDKDRHAKFFHHCLENGVHLTPSPFEAIFVSGAHTLEDVEKTLEIARSFQ